MATRSGRCSEISFCKPLEMSERRVGMGSRGETLIAPQTMHTRRSLLRPSASRSTMPYPVYSVPQSMPRTRMEECSRRAQLSVLSSAVSAFTLLVLSSFTKRRTCFFALNSIAASAIWLARSLAEMPRRHPPKIASRCDAESAGRQIRRKFTAGPLGRRLLRGIARTASPLALPGGTAEGGCSYANGSASCLLLCRQTCHYKGDFFSGGGLVSGNNPHALEARFNQNHGYHHHQHRSDGSVEAIVKNQARIRSGRGHLPGVTEETDARIGIQNLVPRRSEGHSHQPAQRDQRDQQITGAFHFYNDGGRDAERNRGQQLIADAE